MEMILFCLPQSPRIGLFLLLALLMTACIAPAGDLAARSMPAHADDCLETFEEGVDYFPHKVEPVYAQNFTVEYGSHYKALTIENPWQGAQEDFRYLLVLCGTPIPDGYPDHEIVNIPVDTVAALTTTALPRLDRLDAVDRLVAVEEFNLVNTPSVRARIDAGTLAEVGSVDANVEALLAIAPDIIWAFAYGDPQYDMHPKLVEVDLPVVLVADYMEPTPLARAEWLKYYALFFNREAEANEQFAEIAANYLQMAELAQTAAEKPTVFAGVPRGDSWRVPAGQSYLAGFLADAGVDYLWSDLEGTGSLPLSFEVVYEQALDANFWLPNTGAWGTLEDVLNADERYADFDAVAQGNVFNNTGRVNEFGGNDYWETGISNPDQVLADLIAIFHPALLPEHAPIFFRRLDAAAPTHEN